MRSSPILTLMLSLAAACAKPSGASHETLHPDAGLPAASDPTTAAPIAESEPNDSPQSAQRLERSSIVSGQIEAVQPATRPDEDWYLVKPAQLPQDLTVQLSYRGPLPPEPPTGRFVLEAYDLNHDRIEASSG